MLIAQFGAYLPNLGINEPILGMKQCPFFNNELLLCPRGNPFILFFEFVLSSGGDARRGDDQSLNHLPTIIPLNFWHFFWTLFLCMQGLETSVFIGVF